MDVDDESETQTDNRTRSKRKDEFSSATVESLKKRAKKTRKELDGKTPEKQDEILEKLCVETHVGGAAWMKERVESASTPARRLFINYCSRATGNARDRIRLATDCYSLSKSAAIQAQGGKVKNRSVPKRFRDDPAKSMLLAFVETEWSLSDALSDQYETCIDACKDGFALSEEDKMFWGRVRQRARESVPSEGGLPSGVLDTNSSSRKHDPEYIKNLVELESGGEFTSAERDGHERLQHAFGEYSVAHPKSLPKITKKTREKDLKTEAHGEIKQARADAAYLQPIAADDVENSGAFRHRLNPDGDRDLTDEDLVKELQKGEMGCKLTLGVEREILTEKGTCKRAARFLDPRILVAQWVLQWEKQFEQQEGNQTIDLAMEPWMDGTTIGMETVFFVMKNNHLPRQARDKHEETLK